MALLRLPFGMILRQRAEHMRSLIACGIGLTLIGISAKFSPALALILAIMVQIAHGAGLSPVDGQAILSFLWY